MKLLSERLREKGHQVYAFTTRKILANSDYTISLNHSSWIPKKMLTIGNPLVDRFLGSVLAKKLEELNPDLIHVQDTYILPASVLANRRIGIPIVATIRNNVLDWVCDLIFSIPFPTLLKIRNKVILKCLEEVDAVIAVSRYIKGELVSRGVDAEKTSSIYNLYPMDSIQSLSLEKEHCSKVRLFAPGWLTKYKGFFVLLQAMKKVTEREDNVELVIAGDGPERKNLERLSKKLSLEKFVYFIGKVPHEEIAKFYLGSDIVVFPSIHPEAFGRVALEAITFGRPVIASEVGGIPEIVRDGETGVLVPPNDCRQLAEAITFLVKNRRLRESMGEKGKTVARKKFDTEKVVRQHLKVYKEIVGMS